MYIHVHVSCICASTHAPTYMYKYMCMYRAYMYVNGWSTDIFRLNLPFVRAIYACSEKMSGQRKTSSGVSEVALD